MAVGCGDSGVVYAEGGEGDLMWVKEIVGIQEFASDEKKQEIRIIICHFQGYLSTQLQEI